tara:strand:+ start:669 stop:1019 length:351 start_codon:yes stop_codon:yes gene_type:complete
MVPIEKVFLRNKQLEANPSNQQQSPFYLKVRQSVKEKGIINPLLCVETEECEGQKYMCCIGNNRFLAAHALGIKEVPIKILTDSSNKNLILESMKYIPTEVEGHPARRKAYEASKK